MGHLTSRFERTSPHGRVSGWERMSTALMKVESESEDDFESDKEGSRGGCIEGTERAGRVGETLYEDCQCMTGGWGGVSDKSVGQRKDDRISCSDHFGVPSKER